MRTNKTYNLTLRFVGCKVFGPSSSISSDKNGSQEDTEACGKTHQVAMVAMYDPITLVEHHTE